jgi:hypothetical protein
MNEDVRVSILGNEVDKVRANVHDLRNRVSELGIYFQESRDDMKELADVVRALTLKIDTFAATLTATVVAQTAHAEACLREKLLDRKIGDQHHIENKERLDRLESGAIKFLWAILAATFTAIISVALNVFKLVHG